VKQNDSYNYSHTCFSYEESLDQAAGHESYNSSDIHVPAGIFRNASTMQALSRYLVDERRMTFSQVARILDRSPKSIWASYHQISSNQISPIETIEYHQESLLIPLSIFSRKTAPLESLVLYLKALGLKNVDIANILGLDPRTTWTAARRGEARQ
jgi:hypothetical protein